MAIYDISENYLNVAHAAKRAGVSRSAIYQAIQSGRLAHTRIADVLTVISVADVDAFIERRKRQAKSDDVTASSYTLEELVARITDANRHGEVDFGPAVGNEAW